jgi:hypothetical protein
MPSSTMCNEQYRIAVYIFYFSLAFFGLLSGATMCITGVTVSSSFATQSSLFRRSCSPGPQAHLLGIPLAPVMNSSLVHSQLVLTALGVQRSLSNQERRVSKGSSPAPSIVTRATRPKSRMNGTAPLPNLRPFLEKHLPPPSSTAPNLLHLGTGMSTLPSDLHQLCYSTQTAIDFSSVCISTMSALHAFLDLPITWLTMDVCTRPFRPTGSTLPSIKEPLTPYSTARSWISPTKSKLT